MEEFYNSYILINIKDIDSFNDFENKINDLLVVSDSSCPICGINFIYKIYNEEKYKFCFKTNLEILSYPHFLIFLFDTEISNDNLNNNENLKKNQNKILDKLKYEFIINKNIYRLCAIINMPNYNHYNCCIINSDIKNNYIENKKNIFNDGLANNSEIRSENFISNDLNKYLKKFIIVSAFYIFDKN